MLTGLTNPSGLAYNPSTDEIYVGDHRWVDNIPHAEILVFPRMANGDVAPEKVIRGEQTGAGLGNGWLSVLAVDLAFIFADGFEN